MTNAPPTMPGPLVGPDRRLPRPLLGLLIGGGPVALACAAVPIAMGSNLWPVAAFIWFALTGVPAAGVGPIAGALLQKQRPALFFGPLALLGAMMAIAAGVIIYNNP